MPSQNETLAQSIRNKLSADDIAELESGELPPIKLSNADLAFLKGGQGSNPIDALLDLVAASTGGKDGKGGKGSIG